MAIGASQLSGDRRSFFENGYVPNSSLIKEGYVLVQVSTTDDRLVDVPNAIGALLGGRAYVGISASANITNENNTPDNHVLVQRLGVAKCLLKPGTGCTAGDEAAFDPADGGTIVPYTSTNQVPIGKFWQTKTAVAFEQAVGVFLTEAPLKSPVPLSKITAVSGAISNTAAETQFGSSGLVIPASYLQEGAVLKVHAKFDVLSGNANDTLTLRARLDGLAGNVLATTPAVDVVNAGGDIGIIEFTIVVGVNALLIATGGIAGISPGQAVAAGGNVQTTGTVGYVAYTPLLPHTIIFTAQWSAAAVGNSVLLDSASLT